MAKRTKKATSPGGATYEALLELYKKDIVNLSDFDGVEVIPSGSVIIDRITGIGGYPRGRITELWGQEGVSKTTLGLHATAACQAKGLSVAYFDFEGSFCNSYARALGVEIYDPRKFIYFKPATFEEAEPKLRSFAACDAVGLIVIDSVAAMTPQEMVGGSHGIGLLARKLSQFFSCFVKDLERGGAACLVTNQIRTKIAMKPGDKTGEYSPGGQALQFYNSIKIRLSIKQRFKESVTDPIMGKKEDRYTKALISALSVKNKFYPPYSGSSYWLRYGVGVENGASVFDMACGRGAFKSSGSWLYFQFPWDGCPAGEFKVQGEDNARRLVCESVALQKACLDAMNLRASAPEIAADKAIQEGEVGEEVRALFNEDSVLKEEGGVEVAEVGEVEVGDEDEDEEVTYISSFETEMQDSE